MAEIAQIGRKKSVPGRKFDRRAWKSMERAAEKLGAAIELSCNGELVIWTGLGQDAAGEVVEWCEECENGDEVPDDGCGFCGRSWEPKGGGTGE
jgi:hypothetical protein